MHFQQNNKSICCTDYKSMDEEEDDYGFWLGSGMTCLHSSKIKNVNIILRFLSFYCCKLELFWAWIISKARLEKTWVSSLHHWLECCHASLSALSVLEFFPHNAMEGTTLLFDWLENVFWWPAGLEWCYVQQNLKSCDVTVKLGLKG